MKEELDATIAERDDLIIERDELLATRDPKPLVKTGPGPGYQRDFYEEDFSKAWRIGTIFVLVSMSFALGAFIY